MSCAEIQKSLSAYVDRELPAWQKQNVSTHIESCAGCDAEIQALLELKRHLRGVSLPAMPKSLQASILSETIMKRTGLQEWFTTRWWIPSFAAAAALGGWLFLRWADAHLDSPPPPLPIASAPERPKPLGDFAEIHKAQKQKG